MPVEYTERIWRALYDSEDGPERVTYGRRWWELGNYRLFEQRAETLTELGVGGRVLVVGCAFGFLVEQLVDRGVDAYGIDCSPYVHQTWKGQIRPDMVARVTFGRVEQHEPTYEWVVDEDCLPGYEPEEAPAFLAACERLAAPERVVHIVTCRKPGRQDSALTWLTADEWRALAPSHTWLPA